VPAFTPVLLNLSFIAFTLFAAPYFDPPVAALAWAVFLGGVLQLAFQVPFLLRLKMLPRFRLDLKDAGVFRILRQMGPALFGVSVAQVSLVINNVFASFLVTGSVSWLYYADRLMEFPTGLLGVALGTILLPSLAKHYATRSPEEYSRLLDWGLRLTLLLAVPAAVGLALLALPLVATLFHYGVFTDADALATRNAVIAYSVGLTGLIMVKVLAPGFYARQDMKTPVKIALVALLTTQAMNLILIWHLRHVGLALAISVGASVNAALLLAFLRRRGIYAPQPGWAPFLLKLTVAVGVMASFLWFASGSAALWLSAPASERIARLATLVVVGAAAYFAVLWALGFRLRDFSARAVE
jgi:putative peptidoglycan lipid II flippase